MLPEQLLFVLPRPLWMPSSYLPLQNTRRTGHPQVRWLLRFEGRGTRQIGRVGGPAVIVPVGLSMHLTAIGTGVASFDRPNSPSVFAPSDDYGSTIGRQRVV